MRCGECHKWMKSRECPRERPVKGWFRAGRVAMMRHVISSRRNQHRCRAFVLSSTTVNGRPPPMFEDEVVRKRIEAVIADARQRGVTWNEIIRALEDALSETRSSGEAD